jgi:hypothetical protein
MDSEIEARREDTPRDRMLGIFAFGCAIAFLALMSAATVYFVNGGWPP